MSRTARVAALLRMVTASATAVVAGGLKALIHRGADPAVLLKPGDLAPDFSLPGSDGRQYRLSVFRGEAPVVIAWFPKAFTGGCTAQCRSLAANRGVLKGFGVSYFGASVDSPETNRKFAESLGIDYPILSDPSTATARAYGVLGASGYPRRWTFYIGKDGRIQEIDKSVHPSTHGEDMAHRLKALNVSPRT